MLQKVTDQVDRKIKGQRTKKQETTKHLKSCETREARCVARSFKMVSKNSIELAE